MHQLEAGFAGWDVQDGFISIQVDLLEVRCKTIPGALPILTKPTGLSRILLWVAPPG
jgi:hypothetical protein